MARLAESAQSAPQALACVDGLDFHLMAAECVMVRPEAFGEFFTQQVFRTLSRGWHPINMVVYSFITAAIFWEDAEFRL
jgi:hypothetical protein